MSTHCQLNVASRHGFIQLRRACQLRRQRVTACAAGPRSPSTATAGYQRDPELQAALDALLADTVQQGRRRVHNSDVAHHVERFTQLGQQLGLNVVRPEWNDGAFRGLLTTMTSGISTDNVTTLARLTFGRLRPGELRAQTGAGEAVAARDEPEQFKGPLAGVHQDPSRGYSVVTHFQLLDCGAVGRLTVRGLYEMDEQDPAKLQISFIGFSVAPARPDDPESVALWREALAAHNPDMAPDGSLDVSLQPPLRNHLRYLVMDPDLHIAVGGSGSLTCMQRA